MKSQPRLVIIESPFAARKLDGSWDPEGVEENLRYVRAAMHCCLKRGEAPYASHALYTQPGVLNDQDPEERTLGIESGFAWNTRADTSIFFVDRGISSGMKLGIKNAIEHGRPIEVRCLTEFHTEKSEEHEEELKRLIGEAALAYAVERRKAEEEWQNDL
jgi:hypothetical protein